jgi:hypothetical protein
MRKPLVISLWLLATPAWGQVEVRVRTEKPEFLAGEPIFVLIDVKNIGSDPVAYDGASLKPPPTLSVANGERRVVKPLSACGGGDGSGGGLGGTTHPPMLRPGAATTFRYLLRGYRLRPGKYELRVSGTVDVGWRDPAPFAVNPAAPPPVRIKHAITDPVAGAEIDSRLPLTIVPASAAELRAAFAPYVKAAPESYSREGHHAANAILEMAPAFLEEEIVKIAKRQGRELWFAGQAAQALAEIDTATSRAELIAWFDRSRDLDVRAAIVDALARMRHPDNLPFLASLLPGRSTEADDRLRRTAAFGVGMIGGDAAVEALRDAPRSPNPLVYGAVLQALGNTNSRSAVPILIERAEGQKGYVSNDVCIALITLTHRTWCGGIGLAETQAGWRRWWAANGKDARIYGPDECPNRSDLPYIHGR